MNDEIDIHNPFDWSVARVKLWLETIKYENYTEIFEKQSINGKALMLLNEDDVKDLVASIGDRKNICYHIKLLSTERHHFRNQPNKYPLSRQDSITSTDSIHKLSGYVCHDCLKRYEVDFTQDLSKLDSNFKDEKLKTILSICYCFLTCLWTSFILAVVGNRVPDMQKYPPLPDIFLGKLNFLHLDDFSKYI
jgi:hypothetical protein